MKTKAVYPDPRATRVLTLATIAFTLFFAVWVMFAIIGLSLREELRLTNLQFAWLVAIPIFTGSILRVPLGILTDIYGGKKVFTLLLLITAVPTYLVSTANSYVALLIYAFFVGLAGSSFAVGVAWVSAWYPQERQGFTLGVFGIGNLGASITNFFAPTLITAIAVGGMAGGFIPGGWRFIPFFYAFLLIVMAILLWVLAPSQDRYQGKGRTMRQLIKPLSHIRVWRFGVYYMVTFGAYVAFSLWLPKYYVDVFGLDLKLAALLTALFILSSSLLRPVGGYLSDIFGARKIIYQAFSVMLVVSLILSIPSGILPFKMSVWTFAVLMSVIGIAMGIGMATVYKYIPKYFPKDVGLVGGLVGAVGGLGGFFLPLLFAASQNATNTPQATFMVFSVFVAASFIWLHVTVKRILRSESSQCNEKT